MSENRAEIVQAAIEQHDDHDYTVQEVLDALEIINDDLLQFWKQHEVAIDIDWAEIAHETREVIVLADHTGDFWSAKLDYTAGLHADSILQAIIAQVHHEIAGHYTNRSWSGSVPVVIEKPSHFVAGEEHALHEIARRTQETGSVARAVDQYATEVYGIKKSDWATMTGRNRSTVSRTTQPKDGE
jgi:hypothetical protein